MNVPLAFCFTWVTIGMIVTATVWATMPEVIDLLFLALTEGLDEEDIDLDAVFEMLLAFVFVLFWPLPLADMMRR